MNLDLLAIAIVDKPDFVVFGIKIGGMIIKYEPSDKLVVQHNSLINGKYMLTTNELRIFLFMLLRIKKNDHKFEEVKIPCQLLQGASVKVHYDEIREAASKLADKSFEIETTTSSGKRKWEKYPLMASCRYEDGEGYIRAKFNEETKPLLLNITENFTTAQFKMFMNIKSYYGYRLYWFLKQYEDFGSRIFFVDELKTMLGLDKKYQRYNDFKRFVIDAARADLKKTDMPFSYEEVRKGRKVIKLKFSIIKGRKLAEDPSPAPKVSAQKSKNGQTSLDFAEDTPPQPDKRLVLLCKLGFDQEQARQIMEKSGRVHFNRTMYLYEQHLETIIKEKQDVRSEILEKLGLAELTE